MLEYPLNKHIGKKNPEENTISNYIVIFNGFVLSN